MVSSFISNAARKVFEPFTSKRGEAELYLPREVKKELKITKQDTPATRALSGYMRRDKSAGIPINLRKVESEFNIPKQVKRELKVINQSTPLHREISGYLKRPTDAILSEIVPPTPVTESFSEKVAKTNKKMKNEVLSLLSVFKPRSKFDRHLSGYLRKGPSGELPQIKSRKTPAMMPQIMSPIIRPREKSEIVSLPQRNVGVPIPRRGWFAADRPRDVDAIVQEEKARYLRSRQKLDQPVIVQPSKLMEIALRVDKAVKKENVNSEVIDKVKAIHNKSSRKAVPEKSFIVDAREDRVGGSSKILSFMMPSPSIKVSSGEKGLLNAKTDKISKPSMTRAKKADKKAAVKNWVLGEMKGVYK